jgi:hypothetical protein
MMNPYGSYSPSGSWEQPSPFGPLQSPYSTSYSSYNPNPLGAGYMAAQTPGYGYPAPPGGIAFGYPPPGPGFTFSRNITVNGVRLTDNEIAILQKGCPNGGPLFDGSFWYDRKTGCWGHEGGPTVGWVMPGECSNNTSSPFIPSPHSFFPISSSLFLSPSGISVGGDLALYSAQNQGTGVLVNGREMHLSEIGAMQARGIQLTPGSYNMDAFGSLMNVLGTKVAQLFSNPLAQQMSQLFSHLSQVPQYMGTGPGMGQGMGSGGMGMGMPPPSHFSSAPQGFGQNPSSFLQPSQNNSFPPCGQGVPGAAGGTPGLQGLIEQLLGNHGAGKDGKLNGILANYGKVSSREDKVIVCVVSSPLLSPI